MFWTNRLSFISWHGLFLCWGWYFHRLHYKQFTCFRHTIMGLLIDLEQVPFFATYSLFDIMHENMWLQFVLLFQLLAANSITWSLWAQSKHVGEFCFWLFWWWENYFLAKRMLEASWWKFLIEALIHPTCLLGFVLDLLSKSNNQRRIMLMSESID